MRDVCIGIATGGVLFLIAFGLATVVLPWYGL